MSMTPEQRQQLIHLLQGGEEISSEWGRVLFPPEKREYELVYYGKEREEDILANTMAVPLQAVRTFNKNGVEWHNKLIFGDNLQAMKGLLEAKKSGDLSNADGTPGVRLIYIDPPFAAKREFSGSQDQKAYQDKVIGAQFIEFLRRRLVFFRELLSDDGALYVHLDWRKSHYVKVLLDELFREVGFQNEIVWHYSGWNKHLKSNFNRRWESIFYYSKSQAPLFTSFAFPWESKEAYVKARKQEVHKDENGQEYVLSDAGNGNRIKRYLEEALAMGRPVDDVWDIDKINNSSKEHTGYPTQKPELLLERIISASSKAGDLVLDAFAGSGTTCAVAEKLNRRWIGIDCGKLSIYTIQKRLLNLRTHIGNKGAALKAKPFTLYNAGLYDFSRLKELPWNEWRRFALTLFSCKDELHTIGGISFDGTLKACPVQVFDHRQQGGASVTEDTLRSIHEAVGSRIGTRMFIIAPSLAFDFQQDYIQIDEVRYYALRIPYSIIHELHQREFTALKQPADEMAVNDTVDAVGFDFIRTPDMDYVVGLGKREGQLLEEAFIRIDRFYSEAAVREPMKRRGNRETLSMVMLDYNYDAETDVFDLDDVFYADAIEAANWEVRFFANRLGEKIMAVFVDIYGNEARVVIPAIDFGVALSAVATTGKTAAKKAGRPRKVGKE